MMGQREFLCSGRDWVVREQGVDGVRLTWRRPRFGLVARQGLAIVGFAVAVGAVLLQDTARQALALPYPQSTWVLPVAGGVALFALAGALTLARIRTVDQLEIRAGSLTFGGQRLDVDALAEVVATTRQGGRRGAVSDRALQEWAAIDMMQQHGPWRGLRRDGGRRMRARRFGVAIVVGQESHAIARELPARQCAALAEAIREHLAPETGVVDGEALVGLEQLRRPGRFAEPHPARAARLAAGVSPVR